MYNTDEMSLFSQKAKNNLCSHAYIVDGEAGIGKLDFALYCAKAMLCEGINKPCGYCRHCVKISNGDHPDIHIFGQAKTASVDEVREIIRRSTLKPNDSEKQIFIICNAGKLGESAQNALLKLFEEPPATVAIFLLVENRSSLLPTVLSRGQRIHLDGMREHEIREALIEKNRNITERELFDAVNISNGNLGKAMKYLSKENVNLRAKAEAMLVNALMKRSYELSTSLLIPKYKREQLIPILTEFVILVNEAQKGKYGVKNARTPKSEECVNLLKNASKRALARMGEAALVCMQALEGNANVTAAASKLSVDLLSAATK